MPEAALKKPRKKPVRKRQKPEAPNPIDVHVGQRLRLRRTLLGLSQEKLAEKIGLTFQQVQKYERGSNRMTASRLWEISSILDVPIEYFYGEIPAETKKAAAQIVTTFGFAEQPMAEYEADPATKRQSLELVRAYLKINAPSVRKRLFDLTKALAALDATGSAGDKEEPEL